MKKLWPFSGSKFQILDILGQKASFSLRHEGRSTHDPVKVYCIYYPILFYYLFLMIVCAISCLYTVWLYIFIYISCSVYSISLLHLFYFILSTLLLFGAAKGLYFTLYFDFPTYDCMAIRSMTIYVKAAFSLILDRVSKMNFGGLPYGNLSSGT